MNQPVQNTHEGRPQDTLGLRLVMIRHEHGLSQKAAALRCGITARVWQGMEEGRSTTDLLDKLQLIADEFGYDLQWLAFGGGLAPKNDPRPPTPASGGNDHSVPPAGLEPATCGLKVPWLEAVA